MSVTLYNTLTRRLELLRPQHDKHISLYTCGPTVYDYAHIGNWATYIRWDTLVRMLSESEYHVDWVMNITDVGHLTSDADEGEDKLEKGAKREGKTAWDVANFYTKDFIASMHTLNLSQPTHLVRATDHIKEQIRFVTQLQAKGFTYVIDDGVYFDTSLLPDYGKIARLQLDDLRAGARVALNQQKRNPTDFAVWKFSPKGSKRDMEWDSPWGKGFPGWHLECSAIALQYLGETLDIHAGGFDHIPIHHTNEIAQSEVVTGRPLANMWLHSNFITVNDVKLSKSLGNSFSLQDIVAHGYEPLALRLLSLQSHYRSEANFTWEGLAAAANRLRSLRALADLRWQTQHTSTLASSLLSDAKTAILASLHEDLNSPMALAKLSQAEQAIQAHGIGTNQRQDFIEFLGFLDRLFGLNLLGSQDITAQQKQIIAQRQDARKVKDFAKADQFRQELARQGIHLRDTTHGATWYRN